MFVKLQMCVKCVQNGRALRVGGVGCLNTAQQPGLGQAAPHQHIFSSHAAALELLLCRPCSGLVDVFYAFLKVL